MICSSSSQPDFVVGICLEYLLNLKLAPYHFHHQVSVLMLHLRFIHHQIIYSKFTNFRLFLRNSSARTPLFFISLKRSIGLLSTPTCLYQSLIFCLYNSTRCESLWYFRYRCCKLYALIH